MPARMEGLNVFGELFANALAHSDEVRMRYRG